MRRSANALADQITGDEIDARRARTNLERVVARAAVESTGGARAMGRSMRRVAARGPVNSLGQPYRDGQTWACAACGATGPDRDDMRSGDPGGLPFPGCPETPTGRGGCDLVFEPADHHAAIVARRGAR